VGTTLRMTLRPADDSAGTDERFDRKRQMIADAGHLAQFTGIILNHDFDGFVRRLYDHRGMSVSAGAEEIGASTQTSSVFEQFLSDLAVRHGSTLFWYYTTVHVVQPAQT
jgi:hypothetical protein